jgi:ABC-type tungstate transport system permease subunit
LFYCSSEIVLITENASNPTNKKYNYLIVGAAVANDESTSVTCNKGIQIANRSSKSGRTTEQIGIWKEVDSGASWGGWYSVTAIGMYIQE